RRAAPPVWLKWGALAACLVILVGVLVALPALQYGNPRQFQKGFHYSLGGTTSTTIADISDEPDVSDPSDPSPVSDTTTTAAKGVSVIPASDPTTAPNPSGTTKKTKPGETTASKTNPTGLGKTTTAAPDPAVTTKTNPTRPGETTAPTTQPTFGPTTAPTVKPTTKPTTAPTTRPTGKDPVDEISVEPPQEEPVESDVSSEVSELSPSPETTDDLPTDSDGIKRVKAVYPETAKEYSREWHDAFWEKVNRSQVLQPGVDGYYCDIMEQLLPAQDANTVCSPLSTYIAFSMLAEVTDGNTHQQLLDMLGASNVNELRRNVSAVWNANYADLPLYKSLLANSLWLRNDRAYKVDTLNILANRYFASTFVGQMGSNEMNTALRTWTNENTGGLLREFTGGMTTNPDTVMDIVSTIYFKDNWMLAFEEYGTRPGTFHGTKGDATVSMMHKGEVWDVYRADRYMSLGLDLRYGGTMYFLLPNQGVDVNSLLTDPHLIDAVRYDRSDTHWVNADVTLSLPKFSVSAKTDLRSAMRALGVTDVLDPKTADFSPLTVGKNSIYLGKAEHAAMMKIDEEGVAGAAYTEHMGVEPWSDVKIDFTVDRPFLFVVTGADNSILFSGIVRNIP
ncbi:MAG: hypothetical protein IKI63_02310, partial [Clostridia bacterium]|nr:hypothetical protein [Clostridia bacterium]